MDRGPRFEEQQTFFATGRREREGLAPAHGLVPAALAPYRDLTRLRHDFPLLLARANDAPGPIESLSAVVDRMLKELAPRGMEGERMRRQALQLEREIRERAAMGESGPLSEMWTDAAARVGSRKGENVEDVLRFAAGALKIDGEIVGCDSRMPARLVTHAWELAHAEKSRAFRARVDSLIVRLDDILRAAFIHSAEGVSPDALRAAVGGSRSEEFDFEAMSSLVGRRAPRDELPAARRARIYWALAVLRAQRFYPDPRAAAGGGFGYRFGDCSAAGAAFRERLAALVETVKALAVGELEADGRYDETRHDPFFEGFAEHSIEPSDLALFPDYLVCVDRARNAAPENAALMEMLSSGLPVKVLVETGDALEESALGSARFAFGVRSSRLAMTATSLGGVFALQAPASSLYALRDRVAAGLRHRGPALFSVFSGADRPAAGLAPYLTAAAALRSRAFPAFTYDPLAGDNLAARFAFDANPEPEADWCPASVEYSDELLQRATENAAFTFADFALCDSRYESHFAVVPRERWHSGMVPVSAWLALGEEAAAQCVPYVLAVDAEDLVHRVLIDARLADAVRRCRTLWHRLQEMGGIHNAYAERALERERAMWEARKEERGAAQAETGLRPGPAPEKTPALAGAGAASEETAVRPASDPGPARDPDQPWIETARCPSCNECQLINDKLFLYNDNKQAYIGDLKAGTFRQMVEAAESCQVSIIHPGKPWNPGESGLEELIERARPFQ